MSGRGLFSKTPDAGVFVKICGVTNERDARMVVESGADAIGVNLFRESSRFTALDECRGWLGDLAGQIARVAVVVNPTADEVRSLREAGCFDAIQFHGMEDPIFCRESGFSDWIKTIHVRDGAEVTHGLSYETPGMLLDSWSPDVWGGTGLRVNWDAARNFVERHPEKKIFLAGGLHPGNLRMALRIVRPYAVDVASGVEAHPGQKDEYLVREFVLVAKATTIAKASAS